MSDSPKLKRVLRLDSIPLDETYWTEEGYLIDHPIVTSVGIFEYMNDDGTVRRELRLPEHVFDPASLASYKGKPVIVTHKAGVVNKNNVHRETIGTILSEGYQDGDNVRCEIVIHSTDNMKRSGLRELSLGYDLDLIETPGIWKGLPYDAIQTNIRINHLALVDEARAGDQARLNIDGKNTTTLTGGKKTMDKTKKTTRKDGGPMSPEDLAAAIKAFQERKAARMGDSKCDNGNPGDPPVAPAADNAPVSPAAPAAVGGEQNGGGDDPVQMVKDRRDRRDAEGDPATPEAAMGVIAQQDEDICTLLDVIETLQAKQDFDQAQTQTSENGDGDGAENQDSEGEGEKAGINADAADKLFRTRIELVRLGDKLKLDGIETMSILEGQKAIIRAVTPTMRLDGKSPAYIKAAFDLAKDTLNARKDTNYQRAQMMGGGTRHADATDVPNAKKARAEMIARQENGGKK